MNIKEIQELKRETEKEIKGLLNGFQGATGVNVCSIHYETFPTFKKCDTIQEVIIEVRL